MPPTVSDTAAAARTADATQTAATEAVARRASGAAPSPADMADTVAMTPPDLLLARIRRGAEARRAERQRAINPQTREVINRILGRRGARTPAAETMPFLVGPAVTTPQQIGRGLDRLPPEAADQAVSRLLGPTPGSATAAADRATDATQTAATETVARRTAAPTEQLGRAVGTPEASAAVRQQTQQRRAATAGQEAERTRRAAERVGTPEDISGPLSIEERLKQMVARGETPPQQAMAARQARFRQARSEVAEAARGQQTQQSRAAAAEREAAANRSAAERVSTPEGVSGRPAPESGVITDRRFAELDAKRKSGKRLTESEMGEYTAAMAADPSRGLPQGARQKTRTAKQVRGAKASTEAPEALSGPKSIRGEVGEAAAGRLRAAEYRRANPDAPKLRGSIPDEVRRASEGEVAGLIERIKGGSLEAKDRLLEMFESGSIGKGLFEQINKVTASAQKSTRSMNAMMAGVSVPVFDAVDRSKNILGRISQLDNEIAEVAKKTGLPELQGGVFGSTPDAISNRKKEIQEATEQLKTLQKQRIAAADELGNVVMQQDADGNILGGEFETLQKLTNSVRNGGEITPDLLSRFSGDQIFQDLGAVRLTPESRRMLAAIFGNIFPPTGVSAQADEAAAGLAQTLGKEIDPAYLAAAGAAGLGAGLLMGGE